MSYEPKAKSQKPKSLASDVERDKLGSARERKWIIGVQRERSKIKANEWNGTN